MSTLQKEREFAIALSGRAGALALEYQRQGLRTDQVRTKSHHADLVTEADTAVEALIRAAIEDSFPEHGIFAEESAARGLPDTDWTWIVDPIDGTTNFAHGLPLFCINIALTHAGRTTVGVTCEPASGAVFWAEDGQGAWRRTAQGDIPIHVSSTPVLRQALLATGFAHGRRESTPASLAEFAALDVEAHAVRRLGSAALAAAWVAAGLLEGYWEAEIKPWDGAAGELLIREAGGKVTDGFGQPWELDSRYIVATNGQPGIHDALLETVGAAQGGVLYLERRSL
jgi:myo-inositol-1(or 4)-monophosphatase